MGTTSFNITMTLDDSEFLKIGEELYTTRQSLTHKEPRIHLIGNYCLKALKPYEGRLSKSPIKEWLLLVKVLDATSDSMTKSSRSRPAASIALRASIAREAARRK